MKVVTLWVAVDDSLPENGCMRVIPGTQNLNLQELQKRDDIENVLGSAMEDKWIEESKAVDIVLKAGDVSIHHPNIIHGSNPNKSTLRRCGLTIRYIPTTTKVTRDPHHFSLFLLRGNPVPGINTYLSRPQFIPNTHPKFQGYEKWL